MYVEVSRETDGFLIRRIWKMGSMACGHTALVFLGGIHTSIGASGSGMCGMAVLAFLSFCIAASFASRVFHFFSHLFNLGNTHFGGEFGDLLWCFGRLE